MKEATLVDYLLVEIVNYHDITTKLWQPKTKESIDVK